MKALTICQPYAHLICLPETDPRHKRVENRTWMTNFRGTLLIHAGRSTQWLNLDESKTIDEEYDLRITAMTFGAFVATAEVVACANIRSIEAGDLDVSYPWLRRHRHTEGPMCLVLADVRPFARPVPWRGAQGLWDADYNAVRGALL